MAIFFSPKYFPTKGHPNRATMDQTPPHHLFCPHHNHHCIPPPAASPRVSTWVKHVVGTIAIHCCTPCHRPRFVERKHANPQVRLHPHTPTPTTPSTYHINASWPTTNLTHGGFAELAMSSITQTPLHTLHGGLVGDKRQARQASHIINPPASSPAPPLIEGCGHYGKLDSLSSYQLPHPCPSPRRYSELDSLSPTLRHNPAPADLRLRKWA